VNPYLLGLLPLLALLDWARGNGKLPKALCLLGIGSVFAFLVGGLSIYSIWIAVAVALGGSVGMGNVVGPYIHNEKPSNDFEWWQKGVLQRSTHLSAVFLGFLWGALTLFALPWVGNVWLIPLSFMLATPMALILAVKSVGGHVKRVGGTDPDFDSETKRSGDAWRNFNILRSPLSGLLLMGMLWLLP